MPSKLLLSTLFMVHLITYDLHRTGQNYSGLIAAITAISPKWRKLLLSAWLVDSPLSTVQVYNKLTPYIDANDRLIVVRMQQDFAGWLTQPDWDWLNSPDRSY